MFINDMDGNIYKMDDVTEISAEYSERSEACANCWHYKGSDVCENCPEPLPTDARLVMVHKRKKRTLLVADYLEFEIYREFACDLCVTYVRDKINEAMRAKADFIDVQKAYEEFCTIIEKDYEERCKKKEEADELERKRKKEAKRMMAAGIGEGTANRLAISDYTLESLADASEDVLCSRLVGVQKRRIQDIKQALCNVMGDKQGWWNAPTA